MFFDTYPYLFPFVTGVFTSFAGVVILFRGWKLPQARFFALFTFALTMWLFLTTFMINNCENAEFAVMVDRVIYFFAIAVPAVIFHFSSIYSENKKRKSLVILAYTLMVIFWFFVWSPYFIDGLNHFSNGCHSQARILHHVYLVYFGFFSTIVLFDILTLFRNETSHPKRIQHILIFFVLFANELVAISGFLPAYNVNSSLVTYSLSFFATTILMYAMFRHNLFELKVVAMNVFIGLVVVASFIQVFIADTPVLQVVNGLVFIVIVFLGFLVTKNVREEIQSRQKGEKLARYLANANARLRELDKQKTDFVSIASHQLRSPIAAIKGYASLVSDGTYGEVPATLFEPIHRILESGQRIGIMVDDFLNITRIEQGRMIYNMVPQNICKILETVIEELRVVAEEKGLSLHMTCDNKKNYLVKVDEGKMKQIFSNLIDNSIKYTQTGSIMISVTTLDPEHKMLVKIKDTGIGIASEEIQNLFQKFNRASNANDANVLGTGLGLYIAREIMKAHEGWINVESEGVGKGSTFTVELPVCEEKSVPSKEEKRN